MEIFTKAIFKPRESHHGRFNDKLAAPNQKLIKLLDVINSRASSWAKLTPFV